MTWTYTPSLHTLQGSCNLGPPIFFDISGVRYVEVHCNQTTTNVIQRPATKTIKNKSGTHFSCQFFIKVQRTTIALLRPAQLAGFLKGQHGKRMRNKTKEFREKRRSGDQHCSKVKVSNWIQASFIILSAVNERICRELNYNSWTSGPKNKMIMNHWVIRKQ